MRHFVVCRSCQKKFYINTDAKLRSELPPHFYLTCPNCGQQNYYYSSDVYAELSLSASPAGGALLGGLLLGAASGGIGALVGAILGAGLGESARKKDEEAVMVFNSS